MKILKMATIGMGGLLLIGVAFLAYGLLANGGRLFRSAPDGQTVAPSSPAALSASSPYTAQIPLQKGEEADPIGVAGQYLLLRVVSNQQSRRVVVFDSLAGRVAGVILLVPDETTPP
ncbi:hypothetical protein FACS1894205_6690 [Alphaproteobacteria bacterium]|nr:hypothetical protein FACS1894205_6690 [Alphaproteobacteria bacterium]